MHLSGIQVVSPKLHDLRVLGGELMERGDGGAGSEVRCCLLGE